MPEARIKAASRSFSKNPILRQELIAAFPNAKFNDEGLTFDESSLPAFVGDAEGIVVGPEVDVFADLRPSLEITAKLNRALVV